jgi:ATP synthase protein I
MFSGNPRIVITAPRKVAWAQVALLPCAALLGGWTTGLAGAMAAAYGVAVGLVVTLVLVRREAQAMRHPEWDQHRLFKLFILAGVERLGVLAGLLLLGLAGLALPPLPLLLGLMASQLGWLAVSGNARRQTGSPPTAAE